MFYIFYSSHSFSLRKKEIKEPPPFDVDVQKAIALELPKAAQHLDRLKNALGVDFDFKYKVDFEGLHKYLPLSVFKKKMAEVILDKYLGSLVDHLIKFLEEFPHKRMDFLIKAYKKEIEFDALRVNAQKPMEVTFRDGVICISTVPGEFGFLTEKTGENIRSYF